MQPSQDPNELPPEVREFLVDLFLVVLGSLSLALLLLVLLSLLLF